LSRYGDSVPDDEGEIILSLVVVQSGAVREASITSGRVGSPALQQCLVDQVKKVQFRSHADKEVRINVPFVYRVKGEQ
jgi:TonB family protein